MPVRQTGKKQKTKTCAPLPRRPVGSAWSFLRWWKQRAKRSAQHAITALFAQVQAMNKGIAMASQQRYFFVGPGIKHGSVWKWALPSHMAFWKETYNDTLVHHRIFGDLGEGYLFWHPYFGSENSMKYNLLNLLCGKLLILWWFNHQIWWFYGVLWWFNHQIWWFMVI